MKERQKVRRLIRKAAVLGKVPFRERTLYSEVAAGRFPAGINIGRRSVAWDEDEVDDWIAARAAERGRAA